MWCAEFWVSDPAIPVPTVAPLGLEVELEPANLEHRVFIRRQGRLSFLVAFGTGPRGLTVE